MKKLFIVVNVDKFFLSHRKDIAIAAKNAGYDVTIVTHFTGLQDEIAALNLKVVDLPENPTGMNLRDEMETFMFLRKLYKRERPDVIHHVGLKPILWGTVAAYLTHNKNVVNAISGLGYLFSEEKRQSFVTKGICFILKFVTKKTYKFIFQNTDDKITFEKAGISKPNQAVLIKGSGVNLERFAYKSEEKKDNKIIKLIFVGRMIEAKGILVLFEAAKKLKNKYKDKIQFLLCGDLDKNPTALSREQIEQICDGKYIKWLGFQKNVLDILNECHIMVFPSFYEGLPKAVIEAEAVGLPIITADSTGCRDTVDNGYNGFVVPIKDSDALAKKIAYLVDNTEKRKEMGKNARNFAEKNFSIEEVINKHLEIYSSFVS